MKQFTDQTLFTFVEKNANQHNPSATLTSALYSLIFSHNNNTKSYYQSSSRNNLDDASDVEKQQHSTRSTEDDWIFLCADDIGLPSTPLEESSSTLSDTNTTTTSTNTIEEKYANNKLTSDIDLTHLRIMALDMEDIDLIRESWDPVRNDTELHGIQLFRDLFTKFPSYKQYFTNFPDLDLERMHENKRLLKHATKVIETVSYVVDSIGDESKADELNEALLSLVRGHLKRNVGTLDFKNLGIVLVDFICNVNNQRGIINSLVAAWTKLYGVIVGLVEREEMLLQIDTAN